MANELVKREDFNVLSLPAEEATEIVRSNLGEDGGIAEWELDRIKIPAGGAQAWEVPGLSGDEMVKDLVGIIVAWKDSRAYWSTSFDQTGGGSEPDCSSPDAVQGFGDPGIKCADCPNAEWGSGPGGVGQACKLTRQLYLLRPGSMLPVVVNLAPTSIAPVKKYFQRLASEALPYYGVITKLGLEKQKSKGGINYSRVAPEVVEVLSSDDRARVLEFQKAFGPTLSSTARQRQEDEGDDE